MKYLYSVGMVLAFSVPTASANYNDDCMKALRAEMKTNRGVQLHKQDWLSVFPDSGIPRKISDMEYEVLLDLLSGLALYVDLGSGKKGLRLPAQAAFSQELKTIMKRDTIVGARHTDSAARVVSGVLRKACDTLQLSYCEAYDNYPGLINSEPRPLTRRQEQMVKWATLHGALRPGMIAFLRTFPPKERAILQAKGLEGRLRAAYDLIHWAFPPDQAKILMKSYISPYLTASFEAGSRAAAGRLSN